MAERNDKTNSTPTNTAGADKTTTTNPTTEANRNAGKEGEMDREGRQPIGKAHTADEHLHGQDDRNQVTNTPKDGNADRQRTDGPTSNTDERHQTGKNTKGNSDGTDRADQKVVPRDVLLQEVWGYNSNVTTHTLETHIYRLRQKVEPDPSQARLLVTESGGYKLVP